MAESSVSKWPSLLAVMRHAESLATERRKHLEESCSQEVHLGLPMRDVDVPLTSEGREHARATGMRLNDLGPFDVLYVSPYRRTVQTAEEVMTALEARPPLVKEERLREKEWGVLEGLTKHGIRARYPDEEARPASLLIYELEHPDGRNAALVRTHWNRILYEHDSPARTRS